MRNTLSSLLLLVLVTGCASWPPLQPPPTDDATRPVVQETTPVVRTGRYTAVAQGASDAERDPLTQTVTLRFPAQVRTVRAAIEHALRGTGYRFADFDAGAASAPDLPLPDVQRELGPLPLAEALAVLAGESWQTRVNPVTRVVSMNLRPEFRRYLPLPVPEAVAVVAAPPTAPAVAAPAAAAPVQLAAAAPTPALVAASAPATDVPAKPVAVAAAAPPQPVAEQQSVTQPWRPGEQGGHEAVAEAASGAAPARAEVLEDGLPSGQRPKNPWLAGLLRFASLHTDDAAGGDVIAGEGGGGSSPDSLDGSHAEPQPAQLAMAEPSPAVVRAPREPGRTHRAGRDRPDRPDDDTGARTPVATLQPLVRLGPGTLSVVLDTWLRNAGWVLVWKSGADFRVDVPFALDAGTPADPVRLMASLSDLYGIPHCAYPTNRTIVVLQPGTNLREECR